MMTEEAKKTKNEYMKQWRRKNPDKVKANTARYWEKKARERMEQDRNIFRDQRYGKVFS